MPISAIGTRRCLRLTTGVGGAAAIAFAWGGPIAYLLIILTALLLMVPTPPPGPKQVLVLLIVMAIACLWGLLMATALTEVRPVGLLLVLLGVGGASALATNQSMGIIATLFILGNTLIAVVAVQSSAAAVRLVEALLLATAMAVVLAHVVHALFPEDGSAAKPKAERRDRPDRRDARWVGLRSAFIMAPALLLALANPQTYIMILMKGAQLSQQVEAQATRASALDLVLSTAGGGAAALAIWWVLGAWPSLLMLVLLLALATLVIARPLFGVLPSRLGLGHWQNMLVTVLLLIGPAVADSDTGTDIQLQMLIRTGMFMALALYAVIMVAMLDALRNRRVAA